MIVVLHEYQSKKLADDQKTKTQIVISESAGDWRQLHGGLARGWWGGWGWLGRRWGPGRSLADADPAHRADVVDLANVADIAHVGDDAVVADVVDVVNVVDDAEKEDGTKTMVLNAGTLLTYI